MNRHPSRSVLRQILDEPGAVPEPDRIHAASCATCLRHSEAMAADAGVAVAALTGAVSAVDAAVDPAPALRRLRSAETGAVPARPTLVDRLRTRMQLARRRSLRVGAIAAVVVASMGTLVATGVASNVIQIFQPENFVAVPIDITSLGTLPDLTGYGSVRVLQPPRATAASSLADAASSSGLHLLAAGKLPSGVKGDPAFHVLSAGSASFTFSTAAASASAGKLGKALPALPANLDGSSLTLSGGPVVIETVGTQHNLGPFSPPSSGGSGTAPDEAHHGLLGGLGGIPQLVIVQMKAPVLYSDGPTVAQYEDALLSMPGVPPSLASQIRALGDLSSTLPIPIPTSLASAHSADINGSPGLVIGDTTGIASGVVWQSHGLVYGVAGSLTDRQVVAIARSMH
ncbi:MAG TPA: hypothetical protein VJ010_00025 [Actinomycetota bacterium]|nr:hypothetical protein [Actinomycetota bacterium]